MNCGHYFAAEHTTACAQRWRFHRTYGGVKAHVRNELRCAAFGEQQAAAFDELAQRQQAVVAHARTHVFRLIDAAELRRVAGLLPRYCGPRHRSSVQQCGRTGADVRIHHHVELVEQTGSLDLLFRDTGERHAQSIERVTHPAFVLRRRPRMHDRDARQCDRMRGDRDLGCCDDVHAKRCRRCAHGRRIGHDKGAGRIRSPADRECGVGNAHTCTGDFPRKDRRAPVTEMRNDERTTGAGDSTGDARIGRHHLHWATKDRTVGDLERRHMPQQIHCPAGVVIRLRIARFEALQSKHRARKLCVRLIQAHDPVARFDLH